MSYTKRHDQSTPKGIFRDVDLNYSFPDFLLRLDLLGALASLKSINLSRFMEQSWTELLPNQPYSADLKYLCLDYFEEYRLGFKLISKGDSLRKAMMILGTIIPVSILLEVASDRLEWIDTNQILHAVQSKLNCALNDESALISRANDVLYQYFSESSVVSKDTVELLKHGAGCLQALYDNLFQSLSAQKEGSNSRSAAGFASAKPMRTDSGLFAKIMCLLHLALQHKIELSSSREEAITSQWNRVFNSGEEIDFATVNSHISADHDLDAIDMLLRFSLSEIKSARILRRIAVILCVNKALSNSSEIVDNGALVKEAKGLFSKFSSIRVGMEVEDIKSYVQKICLTDSSVDMTRVNIFKSCTNEINQQYVMVSDELEQVYFAKKSSQRDITPTVNGEYSKIIYAPGASLKFTKVLCLIYAALHHKYETNCAREDALRSQWRNFFGKECRDKDISEISTFIASDPYLDAMNMLFKYQIKEIRNERIVRQIVVCLCVNRVLSRLPHNSSLQVVLDESLSLFSRFDVLSIGKEEEDIERYTKTFITSGDTIDERYTEILWKYADVIVSQYKKSVDEINTKGGVRRRYWEEVLEKKEKEMNELQSQIDAAQNNMIYSLIEMTTNSTYDYVLSRLFRFANGYDDLSQDNVRALVRNLLQMFSMFGVSTIGEKTIDKLAETLSEEEKYITKAIVGMNPGHVSFPGWTVSGDIVVYPTVCTGEQED